MRKRADVILVELGHFATRAKAQAAIAAGLVIVGGARVAKSSELIDPGASIEASAAHPWVSRGGVKMAAALDAFALDPTGLACLDVGASTGGFSDVLLARGAKSVVAVDVGHGQFHERLRGDERVRLLERTDARSLSAAALGEPPRAIVCDVSFISLRLALPPVLALAATPAWLIVLIKPQFEAGRENLTKGAVKDPVIHVEVCRAIQDCVETLGWRTIGLISSPIAGGDGAREFLYAARHG